MKRLCLKSRQVPPLRLSRRMCGAGSAPPVGVSKCGAAPLVRALPLQTYEGKAHTRGVAQNKLAALTAGQSPRGTSGG